MRFPKKQVGTRTTAMALALALAALVVTALPASAASVITSFTPGCGAVGDTVTMTGTGFTGMTGVTFNAGGATTPATVFAFVNDTTATADVPAGALTGLLRVDTPTNDTPSTTNFIVGAAGVPTITSFLPTSGPVGTSVVITGTNFGCTTAVAFNATPATSYVVDSATQITATVPAGATTGPLHVTTDGGGPADSATDFTVIPPPVVTSFLPTSGPVGTSVVITGTDLTGATSVTFNGTGATAFTVDLATQITATVPAGATTGKIAVTTPGGTGISAADFTVTTPGGGGGGTTGTATITSFTPTSGPPGTIVVITGTDLTGATSVTFDNVSATFTVNSATRITATVPAGATTGKIVVTTPAGTATSAADFTVSTTGPTVTRHGRSVNLHLRKHLVATGVVHVSDGFNACRSHVIVKIQRLKKHVWKTISKVRTRMNGRYWRHLEDRTGTYRAVARKKVRHNGNDVCKVSRSAPVSYHS